jgi:hypothetical protein
MLVNECHLIGDVIIAVWRYLAGQSADDKTESVHPSPWLKRKQQKLKENSVYSIG